MKNWWHKWSYEVPLFVSDALWEMLVVQFAAWLDRLTLRKIIAFVPLVILILAYAHSIPLPPELMLVGDVLAYIDVFSVVILFGMLRHAAVLWVTLRRAAQVGIEVARRARALRLDLRHRRERSARPRKGCSSASKANDDDYAIIRRLVGLVAVAPARAV